jgi:WD40 repeat protein
VNAVVFSPDKLFVASAGDDQVVRIFDLATGREVNDLVGHTRPVLALAYSPDGKTIVTASEDGLVKLWASDSCSQIDQVDLTSSGDWPTSVAFAPDGKTILVGTARGVVLKFVIVPKRVT